MNTTTMNESPMVFFLPTLHGGGAERVVVSLANRLAEHGVKIGLVLFQAEGQFLEQVAENVDVQDLGARSKFSRIATFAKYISYLKRQSPQSVLVSGHSAYFIAMIGRIFRPHNLIVIAHNTVSKESGYSKYIARMLYRYASQVIAVSAGVKSDIEEYCAVCPSKVRVIPNPCDLTRVRELAKLPPNHEWLRDSSVKVILAVGSLTEQKNHQLLIHAMASLRERDSTLRLVILGEGKERHALEKLVASYDLQGIVDLPGFEQNPFSYMSRASRFVLTSNYEGFGLVIVEALAVGARVISTDCPSGPSEILENGKWGILISMGDTSELVNAIQAPDGAFPPRSLAVKHAEEYAIDGIYSDYLQSAP